MPSAHLPSHAQVLVIGGGPAGTYTAAALAREGFHVVLFEAAKFPRYHVGESLIPSARHFMRFIGAEQKLAAHGFTYKPGSAIKFNQFLQEGYTDFVAIGATNNAWNVVRSEFDHLLLDHAASSGAHVYQQTRVLDILFDHQPSPSSPVAHSPPSPSPSRRRNSVVDFASPSDISPSSQPTSVIYQTAFGSKHELTFDYLVDASGRAGLMSSKYLRNRKFCNSLKNVAVWGYWKNTAKYGEGTDRENAPFFEALSDESGWAWFIPLHKGTTSVGVVMEQKQLGIRSRASSSASSPTLGATPRRGSISARAASTLGSRYLSFLHLAPTIMGLIGDGELVAVKSEEDEDEESEGPMARTASDYSYSATAYAGPGWRLVGDAGAFIDPFFSSGIHLAMTSALSAAASIAASIRGHCTEPEAAKYHQSRTSLSYTRFLIVVLSAYKQIRSQSTNILLDVEENNFDKAFACIRPIIQGNADIGVRLSEDEVQAALDFCVHLFDPTTPEQHEDVLQQLRAACQQTPTPPASPQPSPTQTRKSRPAPDADADVSRLFDVRAPVLDPAQLDRVLRLQLATIPSLFPTPVVAGLATPPASPTAAPFNPMSIPEQPPPPPVSEADIRMVLDKINARRVIHAEHADALHNLEAEELAGFVMRLERGQLGLRRPPPPPAL
ncbi:FAD/NAD(P)-binding domain-containing protein [Epithele typhae]|uniref:FAD/NAD(P)-binding domain-containing protein n=1 Tax=Epithele typhae TaxID=378194 RepID=UPI00200728CA|nr:FAD/NAD(P)-binding domain-containing protein [Epithele typhae]KAH9940367.1 FAD/NAD(P)-binding domain-containing protein [Epithele typhae]